MKKRKTCAIWCLVVATVDGEFGASTASHLRHVRHEIAGCSYWILANHSRRMGSHRIEIAQANDAPFLCVVSTTARILLS